MFKIIFMGNVNDSYIHRTAVRNVGLIASYINVVLLICTVARCNTFVHKRNLFL